MFLFYFAFSDDILCANVIGQISACSGVFLVAGMGKQHEEKEIIYITGGHGCFPYRFSFIDIPDVLSAYSDYK